MLERMVYLLLIVSGLALGSFTNAFVWRLKEQSKKKSKYSKEQLSITKGRSMCPHCGHVLAGKDLIPVLSWVFLRGKCRYCKKPISRQYPAIELLMTSLLTISYSAWPLGIEGFMSYILFAVWGIMLVLLLALTVYDIKWMELPTEVVYSLLVLSISFVAAVSVQEGSWGVAVEALVGSIGLGGLFWLLYQLSGGKWIGGGDVRLGFAMGAFLGWQQALLGLSLAAYIGTLIVVIAAIRGKYHKRMKLPFGPLLIAGWYVSFLWGGQVIDWYLTIIGIK